MHFPAIRFLASSLLAVASLAAGAKRLLTQIPLGSFTGDGAKVDGAMVVDPVTGKLYIRAESELDVIESEATGSIETFSLPTDYNNPPGLGLVVSPYVHRLYFTYDFSSYNPGASNEYLGFFDTLDDQISQEKFIPVAIDYGDYNVVINPVVNRFTGHIFGTTLGHDSVNDSNNWVSVLDSRGSLLATIVPPASGSGTNSIRGMDVDPKRNLAFVFAETYTANYGGSTGTALYVIDGANNTVHSSAARTLPASQERSLYGGSVAVNPDTSRVYVPFNITTGGLATGKNYNVNGTFYLNVYSEQ